MKNWFLVPFLAILWVCSIGQDFSRAGSLNQMNGLADLEKVKFINANFYKLYSTDFDNAAALAQWAVERASKNKWREEEANAQLNWGVITYLSGKYNEVLPKYFRARDLFDSLKNKTGLASINNEMAVFYHKQKDLEKALACLDVSEKLAREINDLTALGTSLGHRGSFLAIRGKFKEAKPYYEEVYKIRVQNKDSVGLGYALNDLAEMATNEGNLKAALAYIDQSTAIREKIGDAQGVAINYVNKGENYFKFEQYQSAAFWLEKCLDKSLAIGFDDLSRHTFDYLAKTNKAMGNFKKAFEWQEKAIVFKDSLYNADRTRVIQELQTKYETEKKVKEIELLNTENNLKSAVIERNYFLIGGLIALVLFISLGFYLWRYRDKQKQQAVMQEQKVRFREAQLNAAIDTQEKERKRFASDLHDGMGQLISALQLSINSIRQNKNADARDASFENSEQILADIHTEIRNIAFNLMPPVLIKEGLIAGLNELIRRVNKAGNIKIKITHHDLPARFSELVEISLYRIIQEFVSNIIKHSTATEVTIAFTGFDDEIVLTLEDNGMGYNLENFQHNEGNGWRNIQARVNLIKSNIDFDVVAGRKNNTVVINIPKSILALNSSGEIIVTN